MDAEFLSRLEPNRFKDLADLNETTWFGYRFVHPAIRVFYFIHCYSDAYRRTTRLLGHKFRLPAFTRPNPFFEATKAQITGLVTATLTADAHGIPYEIWCDTMMERAIRLGFDRPLLPVQLYQTKFIDGVLDAWKDRNERGIYTAKAPQFRIENYVSHPVQNAYQDYLCENAKGKGNQAFWCSRLMYGVEQLTEEWALAHFGADIVKEAATYR